MKQLHMHTVCPAPSAIHSDDGANILTVHVGMQPEDAGVGVSQGPSEAAAAILPPLLLQPLTVRHARLLVHLETPEKHTRSHERRSRNLCNLSHEWTTPSFGPFFFLPPLAKNPVQTRSEWAFGGSGNICVKITSVTCRT